MRTHAYRQKKVEVNTLHLDEDLLASNPNKTPEQSHKESINLNTVSKEFEYRRELENQVE